MDFYKRASIICQNIPYGTIATYGQIALLCQKPKNSRQVGYALRTGKLGQNIPAHRIQNASGILSGAASFETYDQQKILLENEGVAVIRTARAGKPTSKNINGKPPSVMPYISKVFSNKTTYKKKLAPPNFFQQTSLFSPHSQ